MKRLHFPYVILTTVAVMLGACSDSDTPAPVPPPDDPTPSVTELTVKPAQLVFPADGAETQTVNITTDAERWTAAADEECDWLTLIPESATLSVEASAWNDPTKERTAVITVTAGNLTAEVNVTQSAAVPTKATVYVLTDSATGELLELGGEFQAVSENGMWAAGNNTLLEQAFLWSRETGEFTMLAGSDQSVVYGVANDGTVVGQFQNENGNYTAGTYKDGVWTALPRIAGVPERYDGEWCASVSPDGRVITGQLSRLLHSDELGKDVYRNWPAVWIDGVLQPEIGTVPAADELQQGCAMYGASDDGTVLAGMLDFPSGRRSPTVWVNGETVRIYGKQDEGEDFFDGACSKVSPDGRYAVGYFAPHGDTQAVGFIYDTVTGALEEPAGMGLATCVLDDGSVFGQSGYMGECLIRPAGGSVEAFESYIRGKYAVDDDAQMPNNIWAASGNGLVLAGYYIISHPMVGAMTMPWIMVIE